MIANLLELTGTEHVVTSAYNPRATHNSNHDESTDSLIEEMEKEKKKDKDKTPKLKNVDFVNNKWTKILIEDGDQGQKPEGGK